MRSPILVLGIDALRKRLTVGQLASCQASLIASRSRDMTSLFGVAAGCGNASGAGGANSSSSAGAVDPASAGGAASAEGADAAFFVPLRNAVPRKRFTPETICGANTKLAPKIMNTAPMIKN